MTNATAERDIGTETVNYYGEGLHIVSKLASYAGRGNNNNHFHLLFLY